MDGDLNEVISVCRAADTEKAAERKKQIDRLRQLLGKAYVVRALDRNSAEKASNPKQEHKKFAWDSVFQMSRNLIWREAEALQKAKNSQSTTSLKKKQDICGLLKYIVQMADKNGRHLKAQDVVSHIVRIMEDAFTREAFGSDHTNMLLKHILCVRRYWCELSEKTWHELLSLYSTQLGSATTGGGHFDRVVLATIVRRVIAGATRQCDVRGARILPTIHDYFSNVKNERSNAVLEHMVSALNSLCESMALDGRHQVCDVGEQVIVPLLFVWNNRPLETLKDELIRFFQLQMCVHHPRGAKTVEEGAYAVNWQVWRSDVRKLYEALYNDLQQLGGRNRFSTGSREVIGCRLQDEFVVLAADVCHQIFSTQTNTIEVTQMSFLDETRATQQPGGAAKKRRLESGWGSIRDAISTNAQSYLCIPWLQLLRMLLVRYPSDLPEEEHVSLLTTLQQVLTDGKRVTSWCVWCLVALAHSEVTQRSQMTEFTQECAQGQWRKVWAATLRHLHLHHCVAPGYHLLTTLLTLHLVTPDNDLFSLFIPSLTTCCQAALHFLCTYLVARELPEGYRPQYMVAMEATHGDNKYPLRAQLVDWLLPGSDDITDAGANQNAGNKSDSSINTRMLAEVLVVLTLRDSRDIHDHMDSSQSGASQGEGQVTHTFENIEEIYLVSSFDKETDSGDNTGHVTKPSESGSKVSHVTRVREQVMSALHRDTQGHMEVTEPQVCSVERMCGHVCLCLEVLASLVRHGYSPTEVRGMQLYKQTKSVYEKWSALLSEVYRKDGLSGLSGVLPGLTQLYALPSNSKDATNQVVAGLLRGVTPRRMVDLLFEAMKEKIKPMRSASSISTFSTQSTNRRPANLPDLDDDDFGFEDTAATQATNGDAAIADADEFDDVTESQDSDGTTSVDRGQESLLSPSQLSDKERLKLQVLHILCLFTQHDSTGNPRGNGSEAEGNPRGNGSEAGGNPRGNGNEAEGFPAACMSTQQVHTAVFDLLDDEKTEWSPARPYDLQLLSCVVRYVSTSQHSITPDDCYFLLERLGDAVKSHKKDQDVCSTVLARVSDIVLQLSSAERAPAISGGGDADALQNLQDTRKMALVILGVLWKQCSDGVYGRQTRMAVARCMQTFFKVDPSREWAFLKPKPKDHGEASSPQYMDELFVEFVKDKHHGIRVMASQAVKSLFTYECGGVVNHFPAQKQVEAFDLIYTALQEVMLMEGRYSTEEQTDEATNRTSSLLVTLATVARHSPVCEQKAVFAICQMTRDRNLDHALVTKVLSQTSAHLGYSDLVTFMRGHLPYLTQQWVDTEYHIQEFPHELCGYSAQTPFFVACHQTIVPFLVMKKDMAAVSHIAKTMNQEPGVLLKSCCTRILVHILPLFAMSKQETVGQSESTRRRINYANECYEMVNEVISNEVVEQEIERNMEELVVEVLLTLHETSNTSQTFVRDTDPKPNPPCFNTKIVIVTLEYLSQGLKTEKQKSLIAVLSKKHQDSIQRILLSLTRHLSQTHRPHEKCRIIRMYRHLSHTHRPHEKCRIIRMYRLFVGLLLKEFATQLGGSWAFVLRDVIHTLVHNINKSQNSHR